MTPFESLLALQERDLALDRLRHRRATLPARAEIAGLGARAAEVRAALEAMRGERDGLVATERRFEDEARAHEEHAAAQERRLYSGEISSPRELQALQADIEQVRRLQRGVEDRQLSAMEQREPLDEQIAASEAELAALDDRLAGLRAALAGDEQVIDAEAATEEGERARVAASIAAPLLDDYERCRAKANGVGAARLVGSTCQGCHLSIPATEVARVKAAAEGVVAHCDNCGCILVP